ncbi:acylneuraminate cytidylyltransferase family protein [Pedobacter miscanthi]|uniref:acylneuraminate cytidylyltransferase family protein n=1 Tax=Pedobacter miscanthi TaxID=2259170 RepID=UPI00292FD057|nr:acylneuraminate cytidylyltransferase family protein [Pedobacter miscanthi]
MLNILITLCARGGSKGIPGKNIKPLAGKPLLEYTIEVARNFAKDYNAKIALSTDDDKIKQAAAQLHLNTNYSRPNELASDSAGKIDTIRDLLLYEESLFGDQYDYILDLDLTSPLRTKEDLKEGFDLIQKNENALTLFSVNPAARNPYFNMVEPAGNGYFDLIKKSSDGSVMSRQMAPPVYDLNASFYWYKRSFFDLGLKSPITSRSLIFEMKHICFDLDHPIDFEFLEYLIVNKKIDILC